MTCIRYSGCSVEARNHIILLFCQVKATTCRPCMLSYLPLCVNFYKKAFIISKHLRTLDVICFCFRPCLTWRDVQHVMAISALKVHVCLVQSPQCEYNVSSGIKECFNFPKLHVYKLFLLICI